MPPEAGRGKDGSSLETLETARPCCCLDLGLLASRTVRQHVSIALSPVCGALHGCPGHSYRRQHTEIQVAVTVKSARAPGRGSRVDHGGDLAGQNLGELGRQAANHPATLAKGTSLVRGALGWFLKRQAPSTGLSSSSHLQKPFPAPQFITAPVSLPIQARLTHQPPRATRYLPISTKKDVPVLQMSPRDRPRPFASTTEPASGSTAHAHGASRLACVCGALRPPRRLARTSGWIHEKPAH